MAIILLVVALLITAVAYRPVLFNFFAGDDFVHLIWLQQAVLHPELIWRNFHTSWLDGTTTKFYRPLISVFMVSDYVLYNRNGLGFHLTNLFFHLGSVFFIFLICRHLGKKLTLREDLHPPARPLDSGAATLYWPFFAACLFGLYPLHTEAVSWITGRVDAVVTAFITGSFFFYLRSRESKAKLNTTLCLIFMVLGLTSKEMTITLPATFVLFELIFPRSILLSKYDLPSLVKRLKLAAISTFPYWILLVIYFGVRLMALGTFVGGYDDSLLFISNPQAFIRTWINGLRLFVEPVNHELVSARALVSKLWDVYLAIAGVGAALVIGINKNVLRLFVFLCGWLVLCLAPVYKVFAISDDLQGSRLAYVATVPLCMLLTLFCLATVSSAKKTQTRNIEQPKSEATDKIAREKNSLNLLSIVGNTIALGFLALAFAVLNLNNEAWVYAGQEANAIRGGLARLYDTEEGDPQILFVGLPDQVHGAYICRNALPGMTHTPQLQRDIKNAILVDRFEPIFPFALIKQSLYDNRSKVKIYRWDTEHKDFAKVDLDVVEQYPQSKLQTFSGASLTTTITPSNPDTCTFSWRPDNSLELIGNSKKLGRPEVRIAPGMTPCFAMEFVRVTMRPLSTGSDQAAKEKAAEYAAKEGADLLYTNDLVEKFELKCRTHTTINDPEPNGNVELVFPLRSLPEWSLGGKCHELLLRLPHACHYAIDKVEIVPAAQLIPKISFANDGYLGSKGFMHISRKDGEQSLDYDATGIKGADGVMIETTRTNLLFEEQNGDSLSRIASSVDMQEGAKGKIILKRSDFPALGLYQIRLFAKDKNGDRIGQSSDHIVVAVED
ncbi:MAG: hypothetical protein KGS72_12865 [Cyanobacteria bacterium REEB67]|nr:hypothetical protein [Cyanobacteria bacterium REEB67]